MANLFKNYDPGLVVFTWRTILVRGYASGSMIDVERAADTFSMNVGAAGAVTRVRSRDKTGTITLRLQAASPTNDLLTAAMLLDEETGLGYGPALMKDLNATELVRSAYCWIQKPPAIGKADEAGVREWMFGCADLYMAPGGAVV